MTVLLKILKLIAFTLAVINLITPFYTWILAIIIIGLLLKELKDNYWKRSFFRSLFRG